MALNPDETKLYRALRAPRFCPEYGNRAGTPASQSLATARRTAAIVRRFAWAEYAGLVRLEVRPDDCATLEEYIGDMFDLEGNPGYPGGARALTAQRKALEAIVDRDGIVGVVGQFRIAPNSSEWVDADSVWGLEGDTDPHDAGGYGPDIMSETLEALASALRGRCRACRQPIAGGR